jgi:hypothetical protein
MPQIPESGPGDPEVPFTYSIKCGVASYSEFNGHTNLESGILIFKNQTGKFAGPTG